MTIHETAQTIYNRWQKGLLHATMAVRPDKPFENVEGYHTRKEAQEDIDVCLKCNRRKCNGSEACFERAKQRKKP